MGDFEITTSEYVHGPFHSESITGMDICLRKQLVVTCSASYICIWNWAERRFEMAFKTEFGAQATAVAFHPSGFHVLAAVGDKVMMMNVLSNTLHEHNSEPVKNCREIRFSHGGHYFAVGVGNCTHIYDFYKVECPINMQCKGHVGRIQNIEWFEDDSGFADCCNQGFALFYDLPTWRLEFKRCQDDDFRVRNTQILGLTNVPN